MTPPSPAVRKSDIVFAGLGAAACLQLLELDRIGWLEGRSLLVLEPDSKDKNDRTFCFWSPPDSEVVTRSGGLISHSWRRIDLDGNTADIAPVRYHHVRGLDLYDKVKTILHRHKAEWWHVPVNDILAGQSGIDCHTPEGTITCTYCFDSRPLPRWTPVEPEVALIQSFNGWKVRLNDAPIDPDTATLMDFNVEQDGGTQFLYRLPFGPQEMLVELTRFGVDTIDPAKGEQVLASYLERHFGAYEILEREVGCIPMEYGRPYPTAVHDRHFLLGTRAGMVKPSTGYAFKNMFSAAQECAQKLNEGSEPVNPAGRVNRFGFYDHLLLLILRLWPEQGRPIFKRLLAAVPARLILVFLDERTSILEEIRIFSKLQIPLFIRALATREFLMWRRERIEVSVLIGATLILAIHLLAPDATPYLAYPVLGLGLLAIGIPHGALDDLLTGNGTTRKINLRFVLIYLMQGMVMLMIWWASPVSALWLFLAYSAWHFGQADHMESGMRGGTGLNMATAGAFLRGAMALGIILLSHVPELNGILLELGIGPVEQSWSSLIGFILPAGIALSLVLRERKTMLGFLTLAVTSQLPLLVSFGIYFIFQHSWRGWNHIRHRFNKTHAEMFRLALPFHLAAWLILAGLFFLNSRTGQSSGGFGPIGLFFIFLSSLSFPHVIAMHRFYGTLLRK